MEIIVVADEFFFSGSNADGISWKIPISDVSRAVQTTSTEFGHIRSPWQAVIVRFPTWGVWRSS